MFKNISDSGHCLLNGAILKIVDKLGVAHFFDVDTIRKPFAFALVPVHFLMVSIIKNRHCQQHPYTSLTPRSNV